jgi:hypothetical protein
MQFFKNIANVSMVVILMIATMGVTLNKHYCMGQLRNVSLFQQVASCEEGMGMSGEMDCCEDVTQEFKVEDFNKVKIDVKTDTNFNLLAVFTFVLIDYELVGIDTNDANYLSYIPPLIEKDIPILLQSFLI